MRPLLYTVSILFPVREEKSMEGLRMYLYREEYFCEVGRNT